MTALCASN